MCKKEKYHMQRKKGKIPSAKNRRNTTRQHLCLFKVIVNVSKSESEKPGRRDGVPPPTLPRPSFQPIIGLIGDDQRDHSVQDDKEDDGDLADKGTAIVGPNVLKPQAA